MSSLKSLVAKTLLQTVIVRRKIGVMFLKLNWGRKHSERYGSGHIKRRQPMATKYFVELAEREGWTGLKKMRF